MFKHGFELPHRADPFAAREFVDLRRHDCSPLDHGVQPLPGFDVTCLAGVPGIHQQQRAGCTGCLLPPVVPPACPEDRACDLVESGVAPAGVSVARQIDYMNRRGLRPRDAVHVCQPRLARCPARPRQTLPDERVDQARLADIRPPYECDGGEVVRRQVTRACRARHELGGDFQEAGDWGLDTRGGASCEQSSSVSSSPVSSLQPLVSN
jgi:hypothetical protein